MQDIELPIAVNLCLKCVAKLMPNFLTLFLSIFARSQKASFGVCFSKIEKIDVEIFGGPRALSENRKILVIFVFLLNKPYFFKLNLNCTCSQLSFEVHNTLETQNFEIFEIFYYNVD